MLCPHCEVAFHERDQVLQLGSDRDGGWYARCNKCPSCDRLLIRLQCTAGHGNTSYLQHNFLAYPAGHSRKPCHASVPTSIAEDYNEACIVLPWSAKASAALARRCLQHVLHEQRIKAKDLSTEIQTFIDDPKTPSHLAQSVDGIRQVGNFAAHPMKSTSTGEVVEVEPGEAEWLLDTLEDMFEFLYVQPAAAKAKRDALNKKLADAGKKPMK